MAEEKRTYNKYGQVVYVNDKGEDVTQQASEKNYKKAQKEAKVERKEAAKQQQKAAQKELDDYYNEFYKMSKSDYDNLVASSGSGSEPPKPVKTVIDFDTWKKNRETLPAGSSSGVNTIPVDPEVQEKMDTSNDVTRQEKAQIEKTADEVREYVNKNDVSDAAKEAMKKYGINTALIDTNYTKGLPTSIWSAWKDGKFGPKGTDSAKKVRNYLMLNELGTMLSNMGEGIKGGEKKEGLWTSSVRKNMEEADSRNNEKYRTDMNNQMNQLNLGAEAQIELNKRISELMADNTFAIAAKHAGNIEDTIGMWYLKEALGERWGKMSGDKQLAFLSAINAMNNGDVPSAQAIMISTFGPEETANIARQMQMNQGKISNYDANIKKAQSDTAQANAWLDVTGKGVDIVDKSIAAFGSAMTGGVAGAVSGK